MTVNSISEMLIEISRIHHEKQAVLSNGRTATFGDLLCASSELAGMLSALNFCKGDRLAILSNNSIEYIELFYTCALFGFILVPLNHRLSVRELEENIKSTSPRAIFYENKFLKESEALRVKCKSVSHWLGFSSKEKQSWARVFSQENIAITDPPNRDSKSDIASEILLLVFTSGSTGKPKAAAISQKALYGSAHEIRDTGEITTTDQGLIIQPLFHVGANFLWLAHFAAGAEIRLEGKFDPLGCWNILSSTNITTVQLAPTMLEMMLTHPARTSQITNLKTIFYSTAPIREDLLRNAIRVFGNIFVQHYGSTESGVVTTLNKSQHKIDGSSAEQLQLKSAGLVNAATQVKITDDLLRELKANEVGEIHVKHDFLFSGYWRNEASLRNPIEDDWFAMGDLGYMDEQGFLFIVDRKKDLIISGGENIYPRELELVLYNHPAIIECSVVGIPDERWGESVLAEVVVNDKKIGENELISYCKIHLASYKKPKRIVFRDDLPRLSTGKINKAKIKALYWKNSKRSI